MTVRCLAPWEGRAITNPATIINPYICSRLSRQCLSSSSAAFASNAKEEWVSGAVHAQRPPSLQSAGRSREKITNRELVLDVLSSTSGKREAKSYLSRFSASGKAKGDKNDTRLALAQEETRKDTNGVNLGSLFLPARAVGQSPTFSHKIIPDTFVDTAKGPLHVAVVEVKSPQSLDDGTLRGIGRTLSQLVELGLSCVIVVEQPPDNTARDSIGQDLSWRKDALYQADRVAAAIDQQGGHGARRLDTVVGLALLDESLVSSFRVRGKVQICNRNLLLTPLRRGVIPVIAPVGYSLLDQSLVAVEAKEVVLALARDFAGITQDPNPDGDPFETAKEIELGQKQISLDRIIVLDLSGGIPSSSDRINGSHVFINLEQEYDDICRELEGMKQNHKLPSGGKYDGTKPMCLVSERNTINPTTESTLYHTPGQSKIPGLTENNQTLEKLMNAHLENLQLIRETLAILPPSSSAFLTTPQEAANSMRHSVSSNSIPGVGTRQQRNPLIHNLLTDKPIFSSSLPRKRLHPLTAKSVPLIRSSSPATFVKRGMPVTIIPDPRTHPWLSPAADSSSLQWSDPRIDLPRLVHLIEDSFGRKIDINHYLTRISTNLAGIIIAGSYEGGAILTWETPPDLPSSIIPGSIEHSSRLVPYLDKFAVLQRSQGAGGVADVVFSAMVRDCFPQGVCWRSRRDNPVNKWYFERARGTWKLPMEKGAQGWTMFWTTEGVGGERFRDYEGVCRGVGTSWADGRRVLD